MKFLQFAVFLALLYFLIGPLLPGKARVRRGWWNNGHVWMAAMIAVAAASTAFWLWQRLA